MTFLKLLNVFVCAGLLFSACRVYSQPKLIQVFPEFSIDRPVDFQTPPDGSGRIMIVSQPGRIFSITNGAVPVMRTLLDIRNLVTNKSSELGLLGLAFHPRFKENGYFYVDYTADNPLRTVIARFTMSAPASDSVVLSSRVVLLEIPQPNENHNGGCLAFGPDGDLYIAMGDGGGGADPSNNGQNKKVLLGKILRIDVDSLSIGKNYGIPGKNPFKGNLVGDAEEIFAYGFRNPWRFSFDPVTKKMWVGDVGESKYEEIDTVEAGKNYGWSTTEGMHCFKPSSGCDQTGITLPIWEYAHDANGGKCITGGYVYRGKKAPSLIGKYVYGDYISKKLWALSINSQGTVQNELLMNDAGAFTTFGVDADSELYACAYDGKIFKIVEGSASIGKESGGVLLEFGLEQNYPNPFNGETTVPFRLNIPAHVMLVIYDAIGKKVATLADRYFQAGNYSVRWNAGQLSSGVYTCRLIVGSESTSRQILLQK